VHANAHAALRYLELLKKSGAVPTALMSKSADGSATAEGGAAAAPATKSFSAKVRPL
jgi:hypothetical protein